MKQDKHEYKMALDKINKGKRLLQLLEKECNMSPKLLKHIANSINYYYIDAKLYGEDIREYYSQIHSLFSSTISCIRRNRAFVKHIPYDPSHHQKKISVKQNKYRSYINSLLGRNYNKYKLEFYSPTRAYISCSDLVDAIIFNKDMLNLYSQCSRKGQNRYLPLRILSYSLLGQINSYQCEAIDTYKNIVTTVYIQHSNVSNEVSFSKTKGNAKRGIKKYIARKVLKSL